MFQDFIKKYKKNYSSVEEFKAKYAIFNNNLAKALKLTIGVHHKVGVTKIL